MTYLSTRGIIDASNSSIVPLGIGGTFTGVGKESYGFIAVMVSLITDQESRVMIQVSHDNVTWNSIVDITTATFPFDYTASPKEKYYRVVVENTSGVGQTVFSLQSVLTFANMTVEGDMEDGYAPEEVSVTKQSSLRFDAANNLRVRGQALTDEVSFRDDFSGVSLDAGWTVGVIGGASQSVASSILRLSSSTASGNIVSVSRYADFCPVTLRGHITVSQRVANQVIRFGLVVRQAGVIVKGVLFQLDGTSSNIVKCISCSDTLGGVSTQITTATLNDGIITTQGLYYKIDLSNNTVSFSVATQGNNYYLLAQHSLHLPGPYDVLDVEVSIENTGVTTNTNVDVDMVFLNNMNRLQVDDDFTYERISSILAGTTDRGDDKELASTPEGHLEVAIHGPRLPFGSVHTEHITPIFQSDAVYGINTGTVTTKTVGSGTVTASDGNYIATSSAVSGSYAALLSKRRLRYRAGQGSILRFAGGFSTPLSGTRQFQGMTNGEDYLLFGYDGITFGILYGNRGVREVQTLTITAAPLIGQNVTVTLDGVAHLVAVSGSSNIQRAVWEIAQGVYPGWTAQAQGATIVFIADLSGDKAGAFTFSGVVIAGTFAETKAGVDVTEVFIPQTEWRTDKMDGAGSSGVLMDPSKGNVYQIGLQYLGAGTITFEVEVNPNDGNNATFQLVHSLRLPNTLTTTSLRNPCFVFALFAQTTSANSVAPRCSSFAGFIEGQKVLHGGRFTYKRSTTGISTTTTALFTVMNATTYGGITNQSVINLINITAACEHNNPVIFSIIKNGTLSGNPNFASYDSTSCSLYDTAATTVTATNAQVIWSGGVGSTGQLDSNLLAGNGINLQDLVLLPGEWISVCAESTGGATGTVTASLNTIEEQ